MIVSRPSLRLVSALVVVLALAVVCPPPGQAAATSGPCSATPAAGTYIVDVASGGRVRSALVHVPVGIPVGVPAPLLLALHGAAGTAAGMAAYTGFSNLADSDAFIVVYPSSVGRKWNIAAAANRPDDVAFISDLINTLESAMCIDTTRVFAAGVSNGAGMVALLACDISNQLDGIAAVAGDYDQLPPCHLQRPVPLLEIHGTADHVAPYIGHGAHATVDGLPQFVNAWARHDGCVGGPASRAMAPRTVLFRWRKCAGASTVEHVRIVAGAHQWPGATPPDPGPRSTFCASCTIWRFFAALGPSPTPQAPPAPQPAPAPANGGVPTSGGAPGGGGAPA